MKAKLLDIICFMRPINKYSSIDSNWFQTMWSSGESIYNRKMEIEEANEKSWSIKIQFRT